MLFNLGEQTKVQKQNNDNLFNTENMLPVSEIKNNTIILKDGGIRSIMKVTGLNLDFKNYDEVDIVLEQYKRFLNGLSFPIQIVVRNNFLDLSNYLNYIDSKIKDIYNPVLKKQAENYYGFLDDIDGKQGVIYNKEFYIIIPYYIGEQDRDSIKKSRFDKFLDALNSKDSVEQIVQRYRNFLKGKNMLDNRCSLVSDGLQSMGLQTDRLGTSDIIGLLFSFYNPLSHSSQK